MKDYTEDQLEYFRKEGEKAKNLSEKIEKLIIRESREYDLHIFITINALIGNIGRLIHAHNKFIGEEDLFINLDKLKNALEKHINLMKKFDEENEKEKK